MQLSVEQLVERIHEAPGRIAISLSGGGSQALADLLGVPGASRTVLEAVIPYSQPAIVDYLGGRPDQYCSPATARAMAMATFLRAHRFGGPESQTAGIACTASLATDRPKRGEHRAHLAVQTASMTATWSLVLEKDRRSRVEEEDLVARLLLNFVASAAGLDDRLVLDLSDAEEVAEKRTDAPSSWQDLLLGEVEIVGPDDYPTKVIFPGAFNPIHVGHRRIASIAEEIYKAPVTWEISILNVDKPPLDYCEIERRLAQFDEDEQVCLTRAATFEEKSRLFHGAIFLVGIDTLRRIVAPQYYGGDQEACRAALERIVAQGCRFLVYGRDMGTGFMRFSDLDLPDVVRDVCTAVPADVFREDVSSTAIRRTGKW